jgi:hypothetical protein
VDVHEHSLELLYGYIYERNPIDIQELSEEMIEYIKGWRPRLPADEFPEDYPDDDGYDGTYFTLYRGLCFQTKEEYDAFMEKLRSGIYEASGISSWTLNEAVAIRFALGAGLDEEKRSPLYKGVVLKLTPVSLESTFFASYLVHSELEYEFAERLALIENTKQHSKHEDEIVLLPGSYQVTIDLEVNP